jgi:hypothetical protein
MSKSLEQIWQDIQDKILEKKNLIELEERLLNERAEKIRKENLKQRSIYESLYNENISYSSSSSGGSPTSQPQTDFYQLGLSYLSDNREVLYSKTNSNMLKTMVQINETNYMFFDFLKDTSDDYIKLGEVGYCELINDYSLLSNTNGQLTGTFVTSSSNSYTTVVGSRIGLTFSGSSIDFKYFSDTRGGVWNFLLSSGLTYSLSTYSPTSLSKTTKIFNNLTFGTYSITATFAGADPLNPPSGGVARGWFVYSIVNPSFTTFSLYDYGLTQVNKKLILNGSSNKEFAITVKANNSLVAEQWIPQHTTFGTVFGSAIFKINELSIDNYLIRTVFQNCTSISLTQTMIGRNPGDNIDLCNINTTHSINKSGLDMQASIDYIIDTYSSNGYVNMIPVNVSTFGDKMVDSYGTSFNLNKYDGTNTVAPYKDDLKSVCVIENNNDYFLALSTDNPSTSYLKNIGNYPTIDGKVSRFWMQHRDSTINKLYCQTYSTQLIKSGFIHNFNFKLIISKLNNAYTIFDKPLIS